MPLSILARKAGRYPSGLPLAARPIRWSGPAPSACQWHLRSSAAVRRLSRHWLSFTAGRWSTGSMIPVRRLRYYVFTDERAARADFLPAYRRTFAKIGRERGWAPMSDAAVEDLIAPEGALFFGNPETVADKIIRLHELMRIDRFEMHIAHVDHALIMRSIELFGT